jgi:hypothetical protein
VRAKRASQPFRKSYARGIEPLATPPTPFPSLNREG